MTGSVPGDPTSPAAQALLADHDARVRALAAELATRAAAGERLHIDKGGVHHFVPLPGDRRFGGRAVDVSSLCRVLSVERATGRCVVEPGVPFEALVRATLPLGLAPAVVPELCGITVGGAIAGCSVESMSFRYGGLHDRAVAYEVLTTAGEVLEVSRAREPLLFEMLHGSYGTLGVLTKVTLDLVPAKPYVRLEYRTEPSAEAFTRALGEAVERGAHDFVDAIAHGPRAWVLCLGDFVDQAPYASDYTGTRIYYESTRARREDYLTAERYFFRYDTECHWLTKTVPPLTWAPVRWALGRWFLGSTNLIRWSKTLEPVLGLKRRPDVVVDVFIPAARLLEFLRWYEETLAFFPLWIVPYRVPQPYPWIAPAHAARLGEQMIDCAIYGLRNDDPKVDYSALLEEKVYQLGGIKTLISSNHYTRERFGDIYDQAHYRAAKARLDPAGLFPEVYEKMHRR